MENLSIQLFLQNLANGISLGSVYALIAIGYTLIYGILRLINFAHGDIFMLATYFAFYGISLFLLPWYVSFALTVVSIALVGFLIDRIAYKPLRNAPRISALITAIAVSLFLENFAIVVFGGRPKPFPVLPVLNNMSRIGGIRIQNLTFVIPVVAILLLLLLIWILFKTKIGMAMRALSRDIDTTKLMGVDADRVIGFTFALGSGLAAIGGIMYAMKYPSIFPLMGVMVGLKAFIAAVIGGIGNVLGAALGGFFLGILEIMIVALFPSLSGLRDVFTLSIFIIFLIVKPTGILGESLEEKV